MVMTQYALQRKMIMYDCLDKNLVQLAVWEGNPSRKLVSCRTKEMLQTLAANPAANPAQTLLLQTLLLQNPALQNVFAFRCF